MTDDLKKLIPAYLQHAHKGPGMNLLLEEMENGGFYTSPCSGKYHLAVEGGLAEHSYNVYTTMYKMGLDMLGADEFEELKDSITVVALLHDLGKMGQFGKPNYVENILKSGKRSEAEPFCTNKELVYQEHEIRSVIIASKYIDLTEDEMDAILHHNGLFGKLDSSFGNHNFDRNKLSFLLHTADMWASRFMEEKKPIPPTEKEMREMRKKVGDD